MPSPAVAGSAPDVPLGQVRQAVLVAMVLAEQAVQLVEPGYGATHPGRQEMHPVAPDVVE